MSQCHFTREARLDLSDIRRYVAKDSPSAARRLVGTLKARCRLLARFPELGQRCDELAPTLRCFSVGAYMLFYRPVRRGIEIIRVIRGGRDLTALFQQDL